MNGERLLSSPGLLSEHRFRSNSSGACPRGTGAPISAGRPCSDGRRTIPQPPASRRLQLASTPTPSGVTRPIPVTTTRRGVAMSARFNFNACWGCKQVEYGHINSHSTQTHERFRVSFRVGARGIRRPSLLFLLKGVQHGSIQHAIVSVQMLAPRQLLSM